MIESLFPGGKGGGDDEKVKVSSNDTTAGFLNGKLVAGTNVTFTEGNDGGDETLSITSADTNDAVKVSSNDTTPGFLNGKLVAGTNVTFTEGSDGGDETLTIAAAGGVTGFTGSQNTASPNNTVNASRLLVDATSTNADFVAQPKGTGALLAQLPDGAATGGNKRGANAVDLQTTRSNAARVASGVEAVVIGSQATASGSAAVALGKNAIASGERSFAVGGATALNGIAEASGAYSIAMGSADTNRKQHASGSYSTAIGGTGNQASGSYSTAFGGIWNTSSGSASYAFGRYSVADKTGMRSYSSGRFSVNGDCQEEQYVQRIQTTTDAQTELSNDGNAPATATRMSIVSDATYTFTGLVTARRTDANDESAGWEIKGVIDNNAGTTALVGSATVTALGDDSSGTWLVAVEADNTNDALVIKVTGENSKTIRWGATVTLMKVKG